jgi:hypothetical protein
MMNTLQIQPDPMKSAKWFKRLSPPILAVVKQRIRDDGYPDDPDQWIVDLLTTAYHSPRGLVLRLEHATKKQRRELKVQAEQGAELFDRKGAAQS